MYNASVLHLGYGTEDACDVPSKMAAVLMLEGRNSSVEHLGPIFAVREQRRTGNTCKHDPTRKKSGGTLIPEQFPCQSHYLLDHLTMPLYLAWDLCPFRSALLIARLLCRRTRGNQIQHNSAPNQHLVARGVHRRFPRTSYGEVPTLNSSGWPWSTRNRLAEGTCTMQQT